MTAASQLTCSISGQLIFHGRSRGSLQSQVLVLVYQPLPVLRSCMQYSEKKKKILESSSEGRPPFPSPSAVELHKLRHYIAQGAINNLRFVPIFFFIPNEEKINSVVFLQKTLPNGWQTTTDIKMGPDKLRQLGGLNLSEHLHEYMCVRTCRRACAVLLKCLAVSSLCSDGFLHALTVSSS